MTDKLKAQVSAFVDDELLSAESELLVRRLCNDQDLRTAALRYTLMGDAMRGSLTAIRADLASNIMRAIESEPDDMTAPMAERPRWLRVVGGGAVAATVAAVAIFALQPDPVGDEPLSLASQEQAVTVPVDSDVPRQFVTPAATVVRPAGNQSRLNRYLIRHNEYATTMGRQGVLAYSSLGVAEEPERWDAEQDANDEASGAEPDSP